MRVLVWCVAVIAILSAETAAQASATVPDEAHGGDGTRAHHASRDRWAKGTNNTSSRALRGDSESETGFDMKEYLNSDVHIKTNEKPFVNDGPENHGIELLMRGEPKSGTTWLGRTISYIAINLCGNPENPWCEVGGVRSLTMTSYEFELMNKRSGDVFLHFKDHQKHLIPGTHNRCAQGNVIHGGSFEMRSPCAIEHEAEPLMPQDLDACLPSALPECLSVLPPLDPAIWRVVVILRDPRDVVISEREHRINRQYRDPVELNEFVAQRFETIVSWTYVRWYWHTEVLAANSHIVFYEDLHSDFLALAALADFMGLYCTHEQAAALFDALQKDTPSSSHETHELHDETKAYMDDVMTRLLPETLLHRWQVKRSTQDRI